MSESMRVNRQKLLFFLLAPYYVASHSKPVSQPMQKRDYFFHL